MNELNEIKLRNNRVEADKAWETSRIRRFLIALITYGIATYYLYILEVDEFYMHAFVPTGGYILSTLTLPYFKKLWLKYFYN